MDLNKDIELIKDKIDLKLEEYFLKIKEKNKSINKTLLEAMKYSILPGGKRLRPSMLVIFYKLFGGKEEEIYEVACAVEMLHTYSLIHDDLPCMDNDETRRGKKCTHIVYGEDIALLAGDAFLTESFAVLGEEKLAEKFGQKNIIKSIRVLAKMAGFYGMISGQAEDIKLKNKILQEETLLDICNKKTGMLFSAACKIGAICSGAIGEKIKLAEDYGLLFGTAFQIFDDIIDLEKEEEEKITYASFYGRDKAEALINEYACRLNNLLKKLDGDKSLLEFLVSKLVMN